ncbi:unnamed protein product, partial [Polarella glacialis]
TTVAAVAGANRAAANRRNSSRGRPAVGCSGGLAGRSVAGSCEVESVELPQRFCRPTPQRVGRGSSSPEDNGRAFGRQQTMERGAEIDFDGALFACYDKPRAAVSCVASCACFVLLASGIGLLCEAHGNIREARLEAFDRGVDLWKSTARPALNGSHFTVSTLLPRRPPPDPEDDQPLRLSLKLQSSMADTFGSRDSEDGEGIEDYDPLKLVARFKIPCFYRNCSSMAAAADGSRPMFVDDWDVNQLMPQRAEAPTASFEFTAVTANGTVTSFSTLPFPLVFDKEAETCTAALQQRSPTPDF